MNRSDIRDAIREETLVEPDDFSDSKLNDVIDRGIRDLSGRFEWPFLATSTTISTVTDQQNYSLPTDFLRQKGLVRSTRRRKIIEVAFADVMAAYGGDVNSSDEPTMFYLWGNELFFVPVPASTEADAYTLYYYRTPAALANDTDEPEWSSLYHDVLADYGVWWVWRREEDLEQADAAKGRYFDTLNQMAAFYLNRAADQPLVYGDGRAQRNLGYRSNTPFLDV